MMMKVMMVIDNADYDFHMIVIYDSKTFFPTKPFPNWCKIHFRKCCSALLQNQYHDDIDDYNDDND